MSSQSGRDTALQQLHS